DSTTRFGRPVVPLVSTTSPTCWATAAGRGAASAPGAPEATKSAGPPASAERSASSTAAGPSVAATVTSGLISEMPGVGAPVGVALLEERVAALGRLIRAVGEAGGLAREYLLADHPVVDGVHGELEHADRRGTLAEDRLRPLEPRALELGMRHDGVHGAHLIGALGVVFVGQEEHLARELLAHLPREVGATVARVERADIRIRLLEMRVLTAGDREVAHDVQRVAAARGPAGHERDDDLRHEADEALHLEDVQAPCPARLALAVLVPAAPADALVAARAERPAAVLRAGA